MTVLPGLEEQLTRAAARRSVPVRSGQTRRSGRTILLAAALVLVLGATAGAVLVGTGVVGGAPSAPYPRLTGEEQAGMKRTSTPVVLAVRGIAGVGRVEVVGYRMQGYRGRGELLCLDVALSDGRRSGGCRSDMPGHVVGRSGTGLRHGVGSSPDLILGATRAPVTQVEIRRPSGTLVVAVPLAPIGAELARRLQTEPMRLYVAPVPPGSRGLVAVGRAASGRAVWRADVP